MILVDGLLRSQRQLPGVLVDTLPYFLHKLLSVVRGEQDGAFALPAYQDDLSKEPVPIRRATSRVPIFEGCLLSGDPLQFLYGVVADAKDRQESEERYRYAPVGEAVGEDVSITELQEHEKKRAYYEEEDKEAYGIL